MSSILLFGAGRSAGSLAFYLNEYCGQHKHTFILCDVQQPEWLEQLTHTQFECIIPEHYEQRRALVEKADIVLSLLPPSLHLDVIQDCIANKKHFINASYLSPEVEHLKNYIDHTGKLFLVECGLDPGIDHMSAMKISDELRADGYEIESFLSFTGGLVAPESDTNPWHYKISWNPRNVVLAGQGTARFREAGSERFVPYTQLFKRLFPFEIPGLGTMEGYANRDSLSYQDLYKMPAANTFIRGTLRYPIFCSSWNLLVQLGLTDDSIALPPSVKSVKSLVELFLPPSNGSLEKRLANYFSIEKGSVELENLLWLFDTDSTFPDSVKTPAQALQVVLEKKWKLEANDLDLIAMQHQWIATKNNQQKKLTSTLVLKGKNTAETAMAQTVGLPMAIAATLLLEGKLTATGLHRPITAEFYTPILERLEKMGIVFKEIVDSRS